MATLRESGGKRRIRVAFIQRSVPPDRSAAGKLLLDLALGLDAERFEVTILAARVPTAAPREEVVGTVRIIRVGWLGFSRASFVRRLLGLLGAWSALAWNAIRIPRPDVIVTLTDPPLSVALGAAVARIRGCRHVHWAQDVYPEVAVAGGVLVEGSAVHRMLEEVANAALQRCDAVVAIGRCMAERFARRGIRACVISNWSGIDVLPVDETTVAEYRRILSEGARMVAMYSGNLGIVHDFDTLLHAADVLQKRGANIAISIVGDGPRGGWLRTEVASRALRNVHFLPCQPWERFPSLLAAADVHLVTQRPEFEALVVPSKLYDAAASGRPIVFVGPERSEVALAVRECDCGEVVENGDATLLADTLERWSRDSADRAVRGANAVKLSRRCPKDTAVARFERLLEGDAVESVQTDLSDL